MLGLSCGQRQPPKPGRAKHHADDAKYNAPLPPTPCEPSPEAYETRLAGDQHGKYAVGQRDPVNLEHYGRGQCRRQVKGDEHTAQWADAPLVRRRSQRKVPGTRVASPHTRRAKRGSERHLPSGKNSILQFGSAFFNLLLLSSLIPKKQTVFVLAIAEQMKSHRTRLIAFDLAPLQNSLSFEAPMTGTLSSAP